MNFDRLRLVVVGFTLSDRVSKQEAGFCLKIKYSSGWNLSYHCHFSFRLELVYHESDHSRPDPNIRHNTEVKWVLGFCRVISGLLNIYLVQNLPDIHTFRRVPNASKVLRLFNVQVWSLVGGIRAAVLPPCGHIQNCSFILRLALFSVIFQHIILKYNL